METVEMDTAIKRDNKVNKEIYDLAHKLADE